MAAALIAAQCAGIHATVSGPPLPSYRQPEPRKEVLAASDLWGSSQLWGRRLPAICSAPHGAIREERRAGHGRWAVRALETRSEQESGSSATSAEEGPRTTGVATVTKPLESGSEAHLDSPPEPTSLRLDPGYLSDTEDEEEYEGETKPSSRKRGGPSSDPAKGTEGQKLTLDDVNPVGLGRRSRQLFDDVWRRLIQLGQLTQAPLQEQYEPVLVGGASCDFTTPNAEYTTVLVAGATGRVGRVVVRKLLLRGYRVKALVRSDDPETLERLPTSAEVVVGDLGDPQSLRGAVEGVNKIVFCARARSAVTGDLLRVDQQGVDNLARTFLDYNHVLARRRSGRSPKCKITLARFKKAEDQEGWELREGTTSREEIDVRYDGGMDAELEFSERGNGVFKGYVFTKGGYVELAKRLCLPDGIQLDRFEGLLLNVIGDGKGYQMILETEADAAGTPARQYAARFTTRLGHTRVRIPFSAFRPLVPEDPPLDVRLIRGMAVRFEPRRSRPPSTPRAPYPGPNGGAKDSNDANFRLELHFIKALPGGEETDFILVSCAGAGVAAESREKVLKAKLNGETILRNSGLGYTIVRPGILQEEPGGQRALVFDQGNRITQGISCADVADVCVKALHDPTARNKSFDVCYEYTDGQGLYELVAHLPDKSNNYLTPALQLLEKNT